MNARDRSTPPRISCLGLYVDYYEALDASLRTEKQRVLRQAAEAVGAQVCILVTDLESARRAADTLKAAQPSVVVAVPLLATFAELGSVALQSVSCPILIWDTREQAAMPEPYNMAALVRHAGTLGTLALANAFTRQGRSFHTLIGPVSASATGQRLRAAIRALSTAGRFHTLRLGLIGEPFSGMTDVGLDCKTLQADLGPNVVSVGAAGLTEAFAGVPAADVDALQSEMGGLPSAGTLRPDELARSARLACALQRLVEDDDLDAGAINCHGCNCLGNPAIGIAGCYGASRLHAEGKPFACTGDLPTAIALWLARGLGAVSTYVECDYPDFVHDRVLLANEGMGDPAAAAVDSQAILVANENFRGLHGSGASLSFALQPGPATLLFFTPVPSRSPSWRLICAEGHIDAEALPHLAAPHGFFRFSRASVGEGLERLCQAGAPHHGALAPGHHAAGAALIAAELGIDWQHVA